MQKASTPYDEVVYYRGPVQIGRFWLPVSDDQFTDTGPIENHVLVIPTWALEISYFDHEPVVADTTKAMLYNRGCEFRRRSLNPHGDLAYWIAFDDEALASLAGTNPGSPFRHRWAPLPEDAYLVARALAAEFHHGAADPMLVEDSAWWLLSRCLDAERTAPKGTSRQKRAVAAAEAFLALHYGETITLADVAEAAHLSPFHLSRLFHRLTGTRLHQRLTELRLRDALGDVMEGERSLTDISTGLGFSSPSHFSTAFKGLFGVAPSRLRGKAAPASILASRTVA